ncbi:transport permease protein [Actinorhabdospora filicis]|uniref:Transport permease protein n=1 Tax=Actinorhabdospora filicis TaxID=1785913 RepID=A0A9W6SSU6_9ACTN|nr:ABC transporter permease [Actinorhabdospora filicis]GLZ81687.1 transport permease protein [Actinorhabdospora filicis]
MKSYLSLSRAMLIGLFRDKTTLFFTLLFPLMFLVIFGAIFGGGSDTKPGKVIEIGDVAVLDNMAKADPDALKDLLEITKSSDEADAKQQVASGDAAAAIKQDGQTVTIYYSAADRTQAGIVTGILSGIVENTNLEMLKAAAPGTPTIAVTTDQVEDKALKPIQYLTPGLLGWAISMSGVFGAAMTLVTWRQKKTLRRIRLAPVSVGAVVGARVGNTLLLALIQMTVFLLVASLPFFGLTLTAFWWMAIPCVLIGALAFLAIGLLVGAVSKTSESASGLANLIILPLAFTSGSFFPLSQMPDWMQKISYVSPLRYLNEAMLDVMVRGEGPAAVLPNLGVLVVFGIVVGFIATRLFRWDDV